MLCRCFSLLRYMPPFASDMPVTSLLRAFFFFRHITRLFYGPRFHFDTILRRHATAFRHADACLAVYDCFFVTYIAAMIQATGLLMLPRFCHVALLDASLLFYRLFAAYDYLSLFRFDARCHMLIFDGRSIAAAKILCFSRL